MIKRVAVAICALLLPAFVFAAEPSRSFGLLFQMRNLLLSIDPYTDGYQAGAGVKWWMMKNIALRGLVGLDLNINNGEVTADAGVSAALEYHPVAAKVSPYLGALAGVRMAIALENAIDIYAGAMAGVEMSIWENIGAYAEYELLMSLDTNGFNLGIGPGGGVQIGLIIYF
jgi:hypothetical protein